MSEPNYERPATREEYLKRKSTVQRRADPVMRSVINLTAEEMVDWLVFCKRLPEAERDNVIVNLREQYRWHRLQGRLDHSPALAILAEMYSMRSSTKDLAYSPLSMSKLIAALKDAVKDCKCTLAQRESGHLTDCWVVAHSDAITSLKEAGHG